MPIFRAMKAKIGIITTWFERGAAHVSKAIIDVIKDDFEVHIYARGGEVEANHPSAWTHEHLHWGSTLPYAMKTHVDLPDFKKWLKNTAPDVLLFNEQHSWDVILWLKENSRIPIGAYIDYYTDDSREHFALYDFLICNTRRHKMAFQDHPNAWYIPWGADLKRFAPHKKKAHNTALTFFHNAGMNPYRKGCDLVIQAFASMKEKDCKLIIHAQVGPEVLQEAVVDLLNDERITWIQEEVSAPGLYHLGDVYVYPSRLDGIGLSLPEALACGLPAIVPNEGPMNEFVFDGLNGKWVDVVKRWKREDSYFWPMNEVKVSALAQAMDEIALDKDQLALWKDRGISFTQKHLNWHKNAAGLSALLQTVKSKAANPEAIDACKKYQSTLHPKLTLKMKLHRLLVKLGARQVKRMFTQA